MCEEELQNEINKLEIGSRIPQTKHCDSQLPVCINPFYSFSSQYASEKIATDVLYGHLKCNCRIRRRSESVLNDSKLSNADFLCAHNMRSTKNSYQFKRKNRKKIILRDPILHSLQECLHPTHLRAFANTPKSVLKNSISNDKIGNDFTKSCPTINSISEDSILGFHKTSKDIFSADRTAGITDFRDLMAECKSIEKRSRPLKAWHYTDRTTSLKEGAKKKGICNGSTSCSQQARINANVVAAGNHSSLGVETESSCDVTIDELASYFETFVHIPKKMSSMAEMMYI